MLVIVSGPSAVGKSFCVEHFCYVYGFRSLTPYTTRKPRRTESEGLHYHFRTESDLRKISSDFAIGYWAQPLDENWYGYTSQIDELAEDHGSFIIQAYSDIAIRIKEKNPKAIIVFIDYATDSAMQQRLEERFGDSKKKANNARIQHAQHERSNADKFDQKIIHDNPEEIARRLRDITFESVIQTPAPPLTDSGFLSDADIKESLAQDEGIKILGIESPDLDARLNGWSIDLTLATTYYRIQRPFFFRKVFDLATASQVQVARLFRETIGTKNEPILLKPYEFILCSTHESVKLPDNVICILTGRSSYARLGISIDFSQSILQPGHDDTIPLQVKNHLPFPVVIYPGMVIAQAGFAQTLTPADVPYSRFEPAKYTAANDLRSRYYLDTVFEEVRRNRSPRRIFDWDGYLELLLFASAFFLAISWLGSHVEYKNPDMKTAISVAQFVSFGLFVLTGIVRGIRFFIGRR